VSEREIDASSENVLSELDGGEVASDDGAALEDAIEIAAENEDLEDDGGPPAWGTTATAQETVVSPPVPAAPATEPDVDDELEEAIPAPDDEAEPLAVEPSLEHAAGDLRIPDGYAVLEGVPEGGRRAVGVVVARFNGEVTSRLLERALSELESAGVRQEAITVMVVPGAFELPLAATALAKTRRFACVVALGCVIRGETAHFEYVAGEAASGLQLAALETGVPVSFGVLTLESADQADARIEKGADAVRSALEMADVFAQLRAAAAR
jgi:6,7-dimethyl-8-ribityllumazine synthase